MIVPFPGYLHFYFVECSFSMLKKEIVMVIINSDIECPDTHTKVRQLQLKQYYQENSLKMKRSIREEEISMKCVGPSFSLVMPYKLSIRKEKVSVKCIGPSVSWVMLYMYKL